MKTRLPLYTPSLLSQEALEAIFVKREPLLQSLIEAHQQSVTTDNKHFSLFIGPRGIGKTHLLSLFFHRIGADKNLAANTLTAWLREEEWGIAGYLDLLIHILNALETHFAAEDFAAQMDQLYQLTPSEAEQFAERLLLQITGDRTLLLISENMDLIFEGLTTDGQHQFRALIQNSGKITIVAAAQSLFTGVTLRKSPFYGFFDIQHLQPLTIDEAIELLINIAEFDHKPDLVTMLKSPKGRVRVRALHHLANGNPRIYVTFSQLIHAQSLDQFTDAVLQMLDELTPYYQAKMLQIPPQQRKLVQYLCRHQGATQVLDIAKFNHLSHQATSSQLKKLRDAGYVTTTTVGRASYYEIAEPLMRLVLEVKEARATPVRLLINFLRHWFSAKELHHFASDGRCLIFGKPWLGKDFVMQAIAINQSQNFYPQLKSCIDDYLVSLSQGNSDNLGLIAEDLAELDESPNAVAIAQPERFKQALGSQLEKLVKDAGQANNIAAFEGVSGELAYLASNHDDPRIWLAIFCTKFVFIGKFPENVDIDKYHQILKGTKQFVNDHKDSGRNVTIIELAAVSFHSLLVYVLQQQQFDFAELIFKDFFALAETTNSNIWWQLSANSLTHILFTLYSNEQNTEFLFPYISRLIDKEPELNDPEFAKYLSQLLNTQMVNLASSDDFANATEAFKKLQSITEKYQLYELQFTGAMNFWAGSRGAAITFKQMLKYGETEGGFNALIELIATIVANMANLPDDQQVANNTLLWQKLADNNQQDAMISGLSHAAVEIAKAKPQIYPQWLANWLPLIYATPALQQSLVILTAIKHYLAKGNDESQLLTLQKEQRTLIRAGLGLEK